jgi:hypothetical protein
MQVALLRWHGRREEARERLAYWLARDPTDSFLRMEQLQLTGPNAAFWEHVGADAERVLDIADEYLHLGMYGDALPVLTHAYAPAPANQREPGVPMPQDNPLVRYYRAYCYTKTGGKPAAEYKAAALLPLQYVFPGRTSSYAVLRSALAANDSDAAAHWLLGLLDMDAEAVDAALAAWQKARSLHKDIPALHAVLSSALATLKGDQAGALAVQKEGLSLRPGDTALQTGVINTLAGKGGAAKAGQPVMEVLPFSPTEIARLALMRAASGQLPQAAGLFNGRNFVEEKQPDPVRRAYIELELLNISALVAIGHCEAIENGFAGLGEERNGLPFTLYGFGLFIKEARFQYYLGKAEAGCHDDKNARKRWAKVARSKEELTSANFAFPALAAQAGGEADAKARIEQSLASIAKSMESEKEARGMLLYSRGLLERALGDTEKAKASFEEGSKAPDSRQSQYLNLLALRETNQN